MFNIVIDYLSEDDEVQVVTRTTAASQASPSRTMTGADILEYQQLVREVLVSEEVARYAVRLVDASRPHRPNSFEFVEKWVKWGAGLRASQSLILGGKARALMHGRYHVSINDIRALALPIMRHRVVTNFYAESEGVNADRVIERLLESVPPPKSGM
jgi:MoxR-like ATPase